MKKEKLYQKIKRGQKNILIIPIIIAMLILATKVYAGTQDSTLIRNKVDGIYAIAPLSDKTHLYNLEMYQVNGKVAYCIGLGKKVTTTTYNSTQDPTEQSKISQFTPNLLNYAKTISYFGYGYKGHNDYKYYMATQELIWETLYSVNISWTNELDVNGTTINIDSYKAEIRDLVNKYNKELSITNTINCKVGDKITLTDPNNILSFYKISSNGNQNASINYNVLTININNHYIGQDKIILKKENYYDYTSTLYYYDDSQMLLSSGNIENVEKNIALNIVGETLTTNLIDQDTKTNTPSGQATLSGAEYEVYDKNNNLVAKFTTDETGINKIPNLYHDKYYIKQIKPSKGYELNEKIFEIDLTNENNKLTLTEEVIKSTIEINKLYELGDNTQREPNIQFDIYDNNNMLYTSVTTTKDGPSTIILPYGKYNIKQVNTTYGYKKVNDIKLIIDEKSNKYSRYYLVDKKILKKLHITTKDDTTKNNINEKNIKYKIKDKETNKYITYKDIDDNKITEFSTNEKGELTIPVSLPYGEYIIEQVTPPTQYLTNTKKINIIINEKSKYSFIDNKIVINVDFFNIPIVGKINVITNKETIITKDNNYKKELEIRSNIEVELYKDNKIVNIYKTDKDGKLAIDSLPLGKYCLKEKNSNNQKCLILVNNDNKTAIIEKSIELTEFIKTTNVTLNNIDELKKTISGATIELYKENELINSKITDENGNIKINNLVKGHYCFKQIKVPSQYIINEKKLCFDADDNIKDINLTLINNLKQNKVIKIPDTLSNNKISILLPILSILLGAGIYKKTKSINNN